MLDLEFLAYICKTTLTMVIARRSRVVDSTTPRYRSNRSAYRLGAVRYHVYEKLREMIGMIGVFPIDCKNAVFSPI